MSKSKIVFATHNLNKLKEVALMMPNDIELLSLNDIGCFDEIPETADSIIGNAQLKSKYIKDKYGFDCFADDTGLEVIALNNAPGVYSARYAGPDNNADANITKLLKELSGNENRNARFVTAISLLYKGKNMIFCGVCEGSITDKRIGDAGFGYDPIFRPNGFNKTFAQMTKKEKNTVGHRGKAIRELLNYLIKS